MATRTRTASGPVTESRLEKLARLLHSVAHDLDLNEPWGDVDPALHTNYRLDAKEIMQRYPNLTVGWERSDINPEGETMTALTPYDTDAVAQPMPWVHPDGPDPTDDPADLNLDAFGRIDFDTSNGETILSGLRVIPKEGGGVIIEFGGAEDVEIRCMEREAKVHVAPTGNIQVNWTTYVEEHHSTVISLLHHPEALQILEGIDDEIRPSDWIAQFEDKGTQTAVDVSDRNSFNWELQG